MSADDWRAVARGPGIFEPKAVSENEAGWPNIGAKPAIRCSPCREGTGQGDGPRSGNVGFRKARSVPCVARAAVQPK